ncbi:hypothetical protein KBX37_29935 [Micromonospora sp. U56]|uniref:hypothetical protein n=1 Tax=Micromonospora sp. U56 TaxID=2824900 RepID=UPI001B373950|nr:hypothetical protein [Micromonospora sp. U56]MBQ0897242.1 hypothetical protein [Micromonospora sp. U56]
MIIIGLIAWLRKPGLVLDYLKVLAWPLALLAAMWWMKEPIHAKLRDLLRLDVGVASAEFAQARAEELSASVQEDLQTLAEPDDRERSPDLVTEQAGELRGPVPDVPQPRATDGAPAIDQDALELDRRHATERLIKKVATWGYDMGKNGGELPTPRVVWSDGRPELMFEPQVQNLSVPRYRTFGDRERIRNLEAEVRRLQDECSQLKYSARSTGPFEKMAKEDQLKLARDRLRMVYPESGLL